MVERSSERHGYGPVVRPRLVREVRVRCAALPSAPVFVEPLSTTHLSSPQLLSLSVFYITPRLPFFYLGQYSSLATKRPRMAKTAKDGKQEASTGRPKRNPNPSVALLNNSEQVTLPSQKQAIRDFRVAEARRAAELKAAVETEALATPTHISSCESSPINLSRSVSPTSPGSRNSKRAYVSDEQEESEIKNVHAFNMLCSFESHGPALPEGFSSA
jgi:hypothetical protein